MFIFQSTQVQARIVSWYSLLPLVLGVSRQCLLSVFQLIFVSVLTSTVTSRSSLILLIFHQLVWETFFFCSSLHLNLSLLVLWTRQIKIWSCTGIKVWFWYPELFKKWMLLNPLKFNKLHWALKFNSSMAVTILSKLLQFPRGGCSWEFNRNSWCCSHGSGQYCVASFDFDAFNKNVANIQTYS